MFGFGKKKDASCPFCKSHNVTSQGAAISSSGKARVRYICNNCGKESTR